MRRARRQLTAIMMMALFAAAAGHAQAPPPQPAQSDTVTIVGCLVQGPAPNVEEFFVRTPAMVVPAGTPIVVGGAGTAASGSRATTSAGEPDRTTVYRVTGLTAAELKPHLGHRIEVRGQLTANAPPATTAKTTQDASTGRATTTVSADWTIAGVVRATAMKMVAATCQ
jgi:hypothetical protein